MIYKYKITKSNEWQHIKSIFIVIVGMVIGIAIIFYFDTDNDNFSDFFWNGLPFFAIGFLFILIPLIIIHLHYYSLNEKMEMIYDDIEKKVSIKDRKKNTVVKFNLDEIKYVFHTMTPAFSEKRMQWFPWDSYNYSDIVLNDGTKHRITSLMVQRLDLPVGDRYEVITTFFPYPRN